MARYTGPVCRLCRREGQQLFLKGDRCLKKCALDNRNFPAGQHGMKRPKLSDYGVRLREKQKVKRMYGLLENQFRAYYEKAQKMPGVTGTNLLGLLERRLDNAVYRAGFATSRAQARQLVTHGHFFVNGRLVNIPSFILRPSDVVSVGDKSKDTKVIRAAIDGPKHQMVPAYLEVDKANLKATLRELPAREDIPIQANEQLIIELYSK